MVLRVMENLTYQGIFFKVMEISILNIYFSSSTDVKYFLANYCLCSDVILVYYYIFLSFYLYTIINILNYLIFMILAYSLVIYVLLSFYSYFVPLPTFLIFSFFEEEFFM